jgi:beta-1,4-mannosyl-glycoprotein beta-1,4-N-acetylglucosaminyltransferase
MSKPKIFDCFPFFNELELLELRLMELYDFVDYFVISEANKTHVGNPKDFIFEKNKDKFKKYLKKIIYVKVTDLPSPTKDNPWLAENFQRNAISRGLEGVAAKGDKILISDADEIPNKDAVFENLGSPTRTIFKQSLYYYYVNCRIGRNWGGTVMDTYGSFPSPQRMRDSTKRHAVGVYPNGGWHYSYLVGGNPDRLVYKANNIVDRLLGHVIIGSSSEISERVRNFEDLYGRLNEFSHMEIVDISKDKPKSMDKFLEKYPEFCYHAKT